MVVTRQVRRVQITTFKIRIEDKQFVMLYLLRQFVSSGTNNFLVLIMQNIVYIFLSLSQIAWLVAFVNFAEEKLRVLFKINLDVLSDCDLVSLRKQLVLDLLQL